MTDEELLAAKKEYDIGEKMTDEEPTDRGLDRLALGIIIDYGFEAFDEVWKRQQAGRSATVEKDSVATEDGRTLQDPSGASEWIEWDIDGNIPVYTRDYLRIEAKRRNDELAKQIENFKAYSAHPNIINYYNEEKRGFLRRIFRKK